MHKRFSVAALVIVMIFVPLAGRLCAADEKSDSGAALALRLTELAQRILRAESAPSDPAMRQAQALLKAAVQCDSAEPRYLRLLADSQIALHDNAGAQLEVAYPHECLRIDKRLRARCLHGHAWKLHECAKRWCKKFLV